MNQSSPAPGRITDFGDITSVVLKRKWLIILPWILVAVLSWAGSYLLTERYVSFSIVSVDPNVQLSRDLQSLLGIESRARNTQQQQAAVLKGLHNELTSTQYVGTLNDRLQMSANPGLQAAAAKVSNKQQQQGIQMSQQQVAMFMIQDQLKADVDVSFVGESQVAISFVSANRVEAQNVANTLADIFLEERLKQELNQIRSSQTFADGQLQKYERQLTELTDRKTRLERGMMTNQSDPSLTNEANRSELSAEINQERSDIESQQRIERQMLTSLNTAGINVTTLKIAPSDATTDIRNELNTEIDTYGDQVSTYQMNATQLVNQRFKINSLTKQLEVQTKRDIEAQFATADASVRADLISLYVARVNLDALYARKGRLELAYTRLTDRVSAVPANQAELDRLNREISNTTQLRDKFKQQNESSMIGQDMLRDFSSSKYRKVEPAKLALEPYEPNRIKIVGMGIVLGLVLGAAAAIVAELFDKSYKRVEDIQEHLGLPVLGVVPGLDSLKGLVKAS